MELDRIYNEDCLEGMRRIADGSVDCIIADLPYGVLNKGNGDARWDNVIPLEEMWREFKRVVKKDGAILLFGQGMFTAQLMVSNEKMWRYNITWDKMRKTGFLNAKKMPLRQTETISVFYKQQPTDNPQMTKCEPHQRNHGRGRQGKVQTNRCYGKFGNMPTVISDEKYPTDIVRFQRNVHGALHPTQKPVELMEYLVRTYTKEGDVVLDPCIGSGTTAVACVRTGRRYVGFEVERGWWEYAVERVEEEKRKGTLAVILGESEENMIAKI